MNFPSEPDALDESIASAAGKGTLPSGSCDEKRKSACDKPIVFFDGVCGLCNRSVDFVLRRDAGGRFLFAPLQGETAARQLGSAFVRDLSTIALWDAHGVHRRSAAVVRILWQLGGKWRAAAALLWIIPRPIRDLGYRAVARFRYTWFGKREACRMPTPAERARFLP